MRVRLALAVALAFSLAAPPSSAADQAVGQREFEAATVREGAGDFTGAADALEKLGRARPEDPFAADALFEAAVISEEHLSDPARAARLYQAVLDRYPESRLARRARGRAEFLSSSLRTGEAPLREYQEILNGFARRLPAESIARMRRLVVEHPDFALADRALYWLGNALAAERSDGEAEARYLELERRFPSSEWAGRAKKARGDLALHRGHPFDARRIFGELAAGTNDRLTHAAAEEGLAAARASIAHAFETALAIIYLVGYLAYHLIALRRRRAGWRAPGEILYYAPVAVVFVLAAATENRAIGWATAAIGFGGAVVVWLSSALSGARLAEGPMRARERALRLAASALAVVAVVTLAVLATGLTELVLETMRTGPER